MSTSFINATTSLIRHCLPHRLADKLIMCANILCHDWSMVAPYYSRPGFRSVCHQIKDETIKRLYGDIDSHSLDTIIRYIALFRIVPPYYENSIFFYNLAKFFTKEEYIFHKHFPKMVTQELQRYVYPVNVARIMPECFFYHHGLRLLPKSALDYIKDKDFLDLGAYHGESTLVFQNYGPRRCVALEPSPSSQKVFTQTMSKNHIPEEKVLLLPYGIGAKEGTFTFEDTGNSGNCLKQGDGCQCKVYSVDELDRQHHFHTGLIKADLEGMSLEMVKGAEQVIRRDRPVLTLGIYHNEDELTGIYPLLKSWNLNYHFQLDLLSCPLKIGELTLIAIPRELLSEGQKPLHQRDLQRQLMH